MVLLHVTTLHRATPQVLSPHVLGLCRHRPQPGPEVALGLGACGRQFAIDALPQEFDASILGCRRHLYGSESMIYASEPLYVVSPLVLTRPSVLAAPLTSISPVASPPLLCGEPQACTSLGSSCYRSILLYSRRAGYYVAGAGRSVGRCRRHCRRVLRVVADCFAVILRGAAG